MTQANNKTDDIAAMFKPLPELEENTFSHSVQLRIKRIQTRRRILQLMTLLCFAAVGIFALPWQVILAEFSVLSDLISSIKEPILHISTINDWLLININVENIQVQQTVLIAALASLLGGVFSFLMTEV
jgi:archaellum biogenesis protein FlaJ (TadC family)